MKLSKIVNAVYILFVTLWCVWVIASVCDVGFNNHRPEATYQAWNAVYVGDAS